MGSAVSNPQTKGWLVAILELGAWLGVLVSGPLADLLSRKYTIVGGEYVDGRLVFFELFLRHHQEIGVFFNFYLYIGFRALYLAVTDLKVSLYSCDDLLRRCRSSDCRISTVVNLRRCVFPLISLDLTYY